MNVSDLDPPFGTFALSADREAWRQKAALQPNTRWGRWMISRARKKAIADLQEPFDVEVVEGLKARLYPSGNRCEKRALAGVQIWDTEERRILEGAIKTHHGPDFVFFDVGANVGLYSLFVSHFAKSTDLSARIFAIEPGLETCARLEANIAANQAKDITIIRAAISDAPGTGHLTGGIENRGEAHLSDAPGQGEPVVVDTIARLCRTHGITQIHAMKLDIEGHDFQALSGFFQDSTSSLHPEILILETGQDTPSSLVELCETHDYMVLARAGLNTIMEKKTDV